MFNIVVAVKLWAPQWQNSEIRTKHDIMAVVEVMALGCTKFEILGTCSKNFWMLAALYNISIHVVHISGKTNVTADCYLDIYLKTKHGKVFNISPSTSMDSYTYIFGMIKL